MQGNSTCDVMVESWGEVHHHQNMVSFEIHASVLSVSLCVCGKSAVCLDVLQHVIWNVVVACMCTASA